MNNIDKGGRTAEGERRMLFPDGLRGIAAMLVILPHAVGLLAYWSAPSAFTRMIIQAAPFGSCGVQIFFVLSGFVIAYTLRNAKFSPRYVGNFILRRSIRLDPPYWTAIVIYLGFITLRHHMGHEPLLYPSAAKLLAHLFYAQDVLGYGDINVVFWTLCIEIQFYVVFVVLLWSVQALWRTGSRRAPFVGLFVLSLAWPAGLLSHGFYAGSFLPHWYGFLAGAVIWWTVGGESPYWAGYSAIAALGLIAAATQDAAPLMVGVAAGALLLSSYRGNLYRWLRQRPFQLLGRLSYCIYLIHVPIGMILLGALVRVAPSHEIVSYLFVAALVLVTIGFAYAMHQLVEVPALRWARYLKPSITQPTSSRRA
jgi:peptidoglycan/LPS O-acetylase OafA/YrhL